MIFPNFTGIERAKRKKKMNLVFISPNFPDNFRNFCDRLRQNGDRLRQNGDRMTMCRRVPDVFSEAMGNQLYMALLDTEDEVREYVRFILDEQAESVIPGLYR